MSAFETHTLTNSADSAETLTLVRDGEEVRVINYTDGAEINSQIMNFAGDAAEWVRQYLVDAPSNGWTEA